MTFLTFLHLIIQCFIKKTVVKLQPFKYSNSVGNMMINHDYVTYVSLVLPSYAGRWFGMIQLNLYTTNMIHVCTKLTWCKSSLLLNFILNSKICNTCFFLKRFIRWWWILKSVYLILKTFAKERRDLQLFPSAHGLRQMFLDLYMTSNSSNTHIAQMEGPSTH